MSPESVVHAFRVPKHEGPQRSGAAQAFYSHTEYTYYSYYYSKRMGSWMNVKYDACLGSFARFFGHEYRGDEIDVENILGMYVYIGRVRLLSFGNLKPYKK